MSVIGEYYIECLYRVDESCTNIAALLLNQGTIGELYIRLVLINLVRILLQYYNNRYQTILEKEWKNGHQGFQEYSLRVSFMFINVEGILAKIAKMANEYWGNIPQIFSATGVGILAQALDSGDGNSGPATVVIAATAVAGCGLQGG